MLMYNITTCPCIRILTSLAHLSTLQLFAFVFHIFVLNNAAFFIVLNENKSNLIAPKDSNYTCSQYFRGQ